MSIAPKLQLILDTKAGLKSYLGIPNGVPFSQYVKWINWKGATPPADLLFADYTKDRYSVSGVPAGFSDVNEFTRLTAATNFVDGELVEYTANKPRIEVGKGLLIEKSSTELIPNNSTLTSINTAWAATQKIDAQIGSVFEFVSDGSDAIVRTNIPVYPNGATNASSGAYYRSVIVKKTDSAGYITLGTATSLIVVNTMTGVVEHIQANAIKHSVSIINDFIIVRISSPSGSSVLNQFYIAASDVRGSFGTVGKPASGYKITVALPSFMVTADFPQSVIKTSGVQSTRTKDTLVVPFTTGQTVTADKDAGVTMTITGLNAVFEGHGYIRNVRVN